MEKTELSLKQKHKNVLNRSEARWGIILISPWLIGFLSLNLFPMLASLFLSFNDYNLLSSPSFIGLKNYIDAILHKELFWKALKVTGVYTVFMVPVNVVGSLLFALLLNKEVKGIKVYRTLLFIPSVIPLIATVLMWWTLLNPVYGPINYWFAKFGISAPVWLSDSSWALPSIIFISLWIGLGGIGCMMFLAGLQSIPVNLYEVVEIDGGNAWHKFIHITLPMLSPTIFFMLVINIILSFQNFALPYIATQGGPSYATFFYGIYIYREAFSNFRMGYASALAWILFTILILLTYYQFKASKRWVYYEGEKI